METNHKATDSKGFRILLLRGLLGAVGGFVLATAAVFLMKPSGWGNWLGWFLVIYVMVGLPFGVVMGAIVGSIIWLIHSQRESDLGLLSRAIIGTIIGMICWAIVWSLNYKSGYVERSWPSTLLGLALFAAATGGISGIVVGHQRSGSQDDSSQDEYVQLSED